MVRQRGFTLMETLVMLIISALAVTLMMQALSSFNRSREHIVRLEGVRDNDSVALGWLGDSLRGLVSVSSAAQPGKVIEPAALDDTDAGNGLKGDANGFSAQTLTPLLGPPGVPVTVQWQVVRNAGSGDSLEYREPGHQPMILPLNDADALAFSYLDSDGKVHDTWPPKQGLQDPMPQTIQLQIAGQGGGHADHVRVLARSPMAPQPMVLTPYAPPEDE